MDRVRTCGYERHGERVEGSTRGQYEGRRRKIGRGETIKEFFNVALRRHSPRTTIFLISREAQSWQITQLSSIARLPNNALQVQPCHLPRADTAQTRLQYCNLASLVPSQLRFPKKCECTAVFGRAFSKMLHVKFMSSNLSAHCRCKLASCSVLHPFRPILG